MPSKRTTPRVCLHCGADFLAVAAFVQYGKALYCSRPCVVAARRASHLPTIEWSTDGLSAKIPLRARDGSIRAYTIVDATDAEWANQWSWQLSNGYARRTYQDESGRHNVYLHRALLSLDEGIPLEGDHINRDRLDNRRENLRPGTHAENGQNQPIRLGMTSCHRGVSWAPEKRKWLANVGINGKTINVGYFASEHDAANAVRDARKRLMPFAVD